MAQNRQPAPVHQHRHRRVDHIGQRLLVNATLGISAQALVEDRVLDEATATGDVRRICDLFDITVETALRYVGLHDA
ncbi:hypothetical protein ACIBI9_50690 [Nonomuraea sp. NPDC050451]|uniref:hypothetical protein n=1 Tax=Nonomuraea sp. NPDC050451 TaxID=3364364 RepID=UPI00378BE673